MTEKVLQLCRRALQPGDRVVIAVSGGADSMCLAHAMYRVVDGCKATLFIAHINHQLRQEEAESDARFVCAWARNLGLPRFITRVQVRREGGQSEENIARQQRYRALTRICRHYKANKLFTAHHADDQVETFLLNLLRGSGGQGLQGIPPARGLTKDICLVRPLLAMTRAEIETYCRENRIAWRKDATNDCTSYQRNLIRLKLLPQLREINPSINEVLLNTIDILSEEQQLLSVITEEAVAKLSIVSPLPFAPSAISVSGLRLLALPLQRRVILTLLPRFSEASHVEMVLALLDGRTGASVDLPGGWRAYRLHNGIAVGRHPSPAKIPDTPVNIPGTRTVGNFTVVASLAELSGGYSFWLSGNSFLVSSRKPGDYLQLPGGRKKIKDYMIDKKIPRWLRDGYLVFRSGDSVFWVAGLARDQRFINPGPGKRLVYIKLIKIGGGENEKTDGGQPG